MELPSKLSEQFALNTRPKLEEHMLIVMDKGTHEEHLAQPLQTNFEQFEITVTFLSGYKGIFNVTNTNIKFYYKKTITNEDVFIKINIPPGVYEIESLNDEIKRIIIDEEHYTESNYPFTINRNFSTLGSLIEISPQGLIVSFMFDDNIKHLLEFNARTLYEEYNSSTNPVDILSFDKFFLDCDIDHGMIFKGRKSNIIHNWTMTVDPGYKYVEKFSGGIRWYMMQSKNIISSICFELKNENGNLVSFNGQSVTFRLSIEEIEEMDTYNYMRQEFFQHIKCQEH